MRGWPNYAASMRAIARNGSIKGAGSDTHQAGLADTNRRTALAKLEAANPAAPMEGACHAARLGSRYSASPPEEFS